MSRIAKAMSTAASMTIAMLALAACNAKDPSQPKPPTPQAGNSEPASVIPQAQQDALNKARNVEAVLQQGAQRNDAAE